MSSPIIMMQLQRQLARTTRMSGRTLSTRATRPPSQNKITFSSVVTNNDIVLPTSLATCRFLTLSNLNASPAASSSDGSLGKQQQQDSKARKTKTRRLLSKKPPLELTDTCQELFTTMLQNSSSNCIQLSYHQSESSPRMVFAFDFVSPDEITPRHEVMVLSSSSFESSPEKDEEAEEEHFLVVHPNALLKVLGCTLDMDLKTMKPILYDKEGNVLDPNA